MAPKLIDPRKALKDAREAEAMPSASELLTPKPAFDARSNKAKLKGDTAQVPFDTLEARAKKDFRVFLTVVWRHLLGNDPNPIQLDMAYWLQHGPDRSITMAFRGFSKSWITGAYALWRLYVNPAEQILVVSGSLKRAIATTNWCLQLIMTIPMLAPMIPKPSMRQSSQMFDIGNCVPQQSASFMAAGIGGQLVGFRGTCIIPDDVETQTNSLTVVMREKIKEAVKEFESVLVPGGVIKYLGTPHDIESLYLFLLSLRNEDGSPVYHARIWPALFPTSEERKAYGEWLAPYITHQIEKHGAGLIGHSTMPQRFTDEDLAGRKAAMGKSEFLLQFMLDLKGFSRDKYPLKLKDLIVMDLDDHQGPEEVVWGNTHVERDLPVMGFDGDFFYGPSDVSPTFKRWTKVVGFLDTSGKGEDEAALAIVAELHGRAFWLHLDTSKQGFSDEWLKRIAKALVRFGVHELLIEDNFGGGMFTKLLQPHVVKAWEDYTKSSAGKQRHPDSPTGTRLTDQNSGKLNKEARIMGTLEPVTQQHRLVVSRKVIEWDNSSILKMDGEESRHRYAWGYQYTHLQALRDCLGHDDRVESLSGAVAHFATALGVDPVALASKSKQEKLEDELNRLFGDEVDEAVGRGSGVPKDHRVQAARIQKR